MNEFMKILLSLSVSGTLLLLFILGLKRFYRDKFSRRWQYYIWLVAALRFILPFTPDTTVVGSLFERFDTAAPAGEGLISPDAPAAVDTGGGEGGRAQENKNAASPARNPFDIHACLFVLWAAAALALLVRKVTLYQGFIRYVRAGSTEVSDVKILNLLSDCEEKLNIRAGAGLYHNVMIASPVMTGFFRPGIVLPARELEYKELSYIFTHELIHYKQRDMFYKWLVQFVICVHWFNPFVYLIGKEVNKSCELACDEKVISVLDDKARREYGDTLLSFLQQGNLYRSSLASVTLTEGAEELKERLGVIMSFRKKTKLTTVISFMAAFLLSAGGFSIGAYAAGTEAAKQAADACIGLEAAKQAALAHAGIQESGTRYCSRWLEYENKRPAYYKVEFAADGIEYEYEIDLYSGAVLEYSTKYRNAPYLQAAGSAGPGGSGAPGSGTDIGQEAAKQAAFSHAGVSGQQVERLKVKQDCDDGWLEYEVEFNCSGTEYDYTIDAATGNVLKYDCKAFADGTGLGGSGAAGGSADIGREAAKQAAFSHAGVSGPQVQKLKVKQDYDDGWLEYEVEFRYNGMEYDYTIDAATGNILEYECDND